MKTGVVILPTNIYNEFMTTNAAINAKFEIHQQQDIDEMFQVMVDLLNIDSAAGKFSEKHNS